MALASLEDGIRRDLAELQQRRAKLRRAPEQNGDLILTLTVEIDRMLGVLWTLIEPSQERPPQP